MKGRIYMKVNTLYSQDAFVQPGEYEVALAQKHAIHVCVYG